MDTYWQDLLAEWKVALARKAIDAFFVAGAENHNNMRVQYQTLGSIKAFTQYLYSMVEYEKAGIGMGVMVNSTFGVTESNGRL